MADELNWDDLSPAAPSTTPAWDDLSDTPPAPPEGGLIASAKQAIGMTIKGAGQAAADFIPGVSNTNPLKQYGQEVIDANPTAIHSLDDIAERPWLTAREAVGNAGGYMGGILGARVVGQGITAAAPLTGPAAPVVAAIGQAVSWLGPAAIAALPSFGGIRDKQILDDPATEADAKSKAIAALGAGAVAAIEVGYGPQKWALLALTKEGRASLGKMFASTSIGKNIAKGVIVGGAVEGSEELVQNPIEQLASYQDPRTPENVKETLFGGAMGAIGGAVLGGAGGGLIHVAQPADVMSAKTVDEAIATATASVDAAGESLTRLQDTYGIQRDLRNEIAAAADRDMPAPVTPTGLINDSDLPLIGQTPTSPAQDLILPEAAPRITPAIKDLADTLRPMPAEQRERFLTGLSPEARAGVDALLASQTGSAPLIEPAGLPRQAGGTADAITAAATEATGQRATPPVTIDNRALSRLYPAQDLPSMESRAEASTQQALATGANAAAIDRLNTLEPVDQGVPGVPPMYAQMSDADLKRASRSKNKVVAVAAKAALVQRQTAMAQQQAVNAEATQATLDAERSSLARDVTPTQAVPEAVEPEQFNPQEMAPVVAKGMRVMGKMLGKKIVFMRGMDSDGMVRDSNTIYISPQSSMSPMSVMGHEFWHQMKQTHRPVWDSAAATLSKGLTDDVLVTHFRDYYGQNETLKNWSDEQIKAELASTTNWEGGRQAENRTLKDFLTEEMLSDLGGNRFTDTQFWNDVFAQLAEREGGSRAKSLIREFVSKLVKMINDLIALVRGNPQFAIESNLDVDHLKAVKAALTKSMADYLQKTEMGTQQLRAEQAALKPVTGEQPPRVFFEVAPDPRDAAALATWSKLTDAQKEEVSKRVREGVIPGLLRDIGVKGEVHEQLGGWGDATNPSFALVLTGGDVNKAMRAIGYALRQEAVFAMSIQNFAGGEKTGILEIDVRGLDAQAVHELYMQVRAIDKEAVSGHSTIDGFMQIGVPVEKVGDLGLKAALALKGRDVHYFEGHSAEVKEYGYGIDQGATPGQPAAEGRRVNYWQSKADQLVADAVGQTSRSERRPDASGSGRIRSGRTPAEYGRGQAQSSAVEGFHYSTAQRQELDSSKYGTGMPGAERVRLNRESAVPAQRQRIHFYVDTGSGVTPESGVGYYAHRVKLNNLYDWDADPLGLWKLAADRYTDHADRSNYVEQAAIAHGFDGVYAPHAQPKQGVAVLIGEHKVGVDYAGMGRQTSERRTERRMSLDEFGENVSEGLNTEYSEVARHLFSFTQHMKAQAINRALASVEYPAYKAQLDRLLTATFPDGNIPVTRIEGYAGKRGAAVDYVSVSTTPGWGVASAERGKAVKQFVVHPEDVVAAGNTEEGELIVTRKSLDANRMSEKRGINDWWYSPLVRHVESAQMQSAPAKGWHEWVKSLPAKGVKPDEIKWSGIEEWLDAHGTNKITKAEVQAYLDANGVKIETVLRGDKDVDNTVASDYDPEYEDIEMDFSWGDFEVEEPDEGWLQESARERLDEAIEEDLNDYYQGDRGRFKQQARAELGDMFEPTPEQVEGRARQIAEQELYADAIENNEKEIEETYEDYLDDTDGDEDAARLLAAKALQEEEKLKQLVEREREWYWQDDESPASRKIDVEVDGETYTFIHESAYGEHRLYYRGDEVPLDTRNYRVDRADLQSAIYQYLTETVGVDSQRPVEPDVGDGYRRTKWESFVTDSRSAVAGSYREVQLLLPKGQVGVPRTTRHEGIEFQYFDEKGALVGATMSEEVAQRRAENPGWRYKQVSNHVETEREGTQDFYYTTHWDEANVVGHARFDEHIDSDGKRVMVVQEVQGDWGQQRRDYLEQKAEFEKSIKTKLLDLQVQNDQFAADLKAIKNALRDGLTETPEFGYLANAEEYTLRQLDRTASEIERAAAETFSGRERPVAPFIEKTTGWATLVMKRLIAHAVEYGFDKVVWTSGAQQVERWRSGLQQRVDRIAWEKTPEGIHIVATQGGSKRADTRYKENELSDAIGKTMAQQIVANPNQSGEITGNDITVSDTGMAGFYDRMLPNITNDILKKFDKSVRVKDIEVHRAPTYSLRPDEGTPGYWRILQDGKELVARPTKELAEENILQLEDKRQATDITTQQGFEITGKLRESAAQGMPLFSERRRHEAQRRAHDITTPEFKAWFGNSQIVNADGTPKIMYHGTARDIRAFKPKQAGAIFLTDDPEFADIFTSTSAAWKRRNKVSDGVGQNIIPLVVKAENPFDYENQSHIDAMVAAIGEDWAGKVYDNGEFKPGTHTAYDVMDGSWSAIESAPVQKYIREHHDGFWVKEGGVKNLAVYQPSQVKSAITNTGEYATDQIDRSERRVPWYYSQLERAISDAPAKVFTTGKQVSMWLQANAGKLGVKKDELQWSGVTDWLATQGKVTQDDVKAFLKTGGVQLEETVLGDKPGTHLREDLRPYDITVTDLNENQWLLTAVDGRTVEVGKGVVGRLEAKRYGERYFNNQAVEKNRARAMLSDNTKFSGYVLPGGKNYRELLLRLPGKNAEYEYQVYGAFPSGPFRTREAAQNYVDRLTTLGANEPGINDSIEKFPFRIERLRTEASRAGEFRSTHYDQPNIVTHVRTNERTDADGNRVLFIEEIQSDWAQKGRKEGFDGRTAADIEAELSAVTRERSALLQEAADLPDSEMAAFKRMTARIKALGEKATALDAEFQNAVGKPRIPSAPFVTDTKSWTALALKRMIAYAVEKGFDKIAWTTGEQQADRYDLSKQVAALTYVKNADGTFDITAYTDAGPGRMLESHDLATGVAETALEDYVGKEVAKKMIAGEGEPSRVEGHFTLRGTALKVGGEGMRGYYDGIVPQVANDILKKIGGEKVGQVDVSTPLKVGDPPRIIGKDAPFKPQLQPGFTITDKMREMVGKGQPLFSERRIIGDSGRQYTAAQQAFHKHVGRDVEVKSTVERIKGWAATNWRQGIFDQFEPIKKLSEKAYALTRLSKGATGAFEAFMRYGKLSLRDGVYDADTSGGVIDKVFRPLGRETTDFLYWIAGNRAEFLSKEDRENLMSNADIAAAKSLADGTLDFDYVLSNGTTTRSRREAYSDSLTKFNTYNKNVLDMAEQSGLIDAESRKVWEQEFYVPFYRVADFDDGGVRGMNIKQGIIRQKAFETLKGGTGQLNDLLENTLMNWAHLIDASAKNRAAKATLAAAKNLGVARDAKHGEKHTVWYMDGNKKVEMVVSDPHLLAALNGLEFAGLRGPAMDMLSATKHWLTMGVTASPFFKVRNLIRDSMQSMAVSDLSLNPAANITKGYKATKGKGQDYVSALAGGALIRFGTMLEGNESRRTRELIKLGTPDSHILDNESKLEQFWDKYLSPAVAKYNEIGNISEEINRMALYNQMVASGQSHAAASLAARDLMDFSMQGAWTSVRFLTQVVPFMNARLQGMYKLGRAAGSDPAKFSVVTGGVALASLALLAAYGDDDDWKKRPNWDRDNYWWFKLGGEVFRIPKPFEIGAIGTLAERTAELMFDDKMTGKRFKEATTKLLWDQLAMNPVPQLVKPVLDVYANKNSFTQRPIESLSMQRLQPEMRFNSNTSMVARGASQAMGGMLSPVQIDSLVRGYFSWLGAFAVGTADLAVRAVSDEPTRPALDYFKFATGGMVASAEGAESRYVSQLYDQAAEIEQAYATHRQLLKEGKRDEAKEFRADHKDLLQQHKSVAAIKRQLSAMNEQIRMIERSSLHPAEKRIRINRIRERESELAQRLVK